MDGALAGETCGGSGSYTGKLPVVIIANLNEFTCRKKRNGL